MKPKLKQQMEFDTLLLLATNELSMCRSKEDRHWGAAWAYHDVAKRMYGTAATAIADTIHAAAEKL